MSFNDLTLSDWDGFSEAEAQRYAEELASSLPQPVTFAGLNVVRYAGRARRIAQFTYREALFSLIPGGDIPVGYEAERFVPTKEQEESFRNSAEDYDFDPDVRVYLKSVLTPLRTVTFRPFLVETQPVEIGLEPISPDEPRIQERLKEFPGGVEVHKQYRIRRNEDGSVSAWRIVQTAHADLTSQLSREGFRLLTSDEWEYVCGAGAQTLFRWGDACLCDRYPTDNTADEIWRKRAWVLSSGQISFEPDEPDWTLHRTPNLFGLHIAQNPYDYEVVAEKGVIRGGDGGCSICGGMGFFLGWLPIATAFCDPNCGEWLEDDLSNGYMRRVIPIT